LWRVGCNPDGQPTGEATKHYHRCPSQKGSNRRDLWNRNSTFPCRAIIECLHTERATLRVPGAVVGPSVRLDAVPVRAKGDRGMPIDFSDMLDDACAEVLHPREIFFTLTLVALRIDSSFHQTLCREARANSILLPQRSRCRLRARPWRQKCTPAMSNLDRIATLSRRQPSLAIEELTLQSHRAAECAT